MTADRRRLLKVSLALLGRANPDLVETRITFRVRGGVETYRVNGWDADLGCLVAERIDGE